MIPFEVIALSPYAREWLTEHARRRRGRRLRDRLRRVIEVGEAQPDDWNGLLSLYSSFGFAQRTQGMPPLGPDRQAAWVDELLKRGPNIVARFAGRIIGHAALVAYDHATSYELVVFVHRDYQGVGIGGAVLDALLRLARRRGVERVWLTVGRENRRAAALYRGRGFRPLRDNTADTAVAARSDKDVWTLSPPTLSPNGSGAWARTMAAIGSASWIRLRALAHAMRLVMIPLVCALVIAVASEDPRGRTLALVLVLASLVFGVVIQGREILFGRSDHQRTPNDSPMSTGEWMVRMP